MRYINKICYVLMGLLMSASVLVGCGSKAIAPNFLFSLPLGTLPGEFKHWDRNLQKKNTSNMVFRNGVFYFSNGNRIFSVSSNGYLLDYIVNDPLLLQSYKEGSNILQGTIPFKVYPLQSIKDMAITSNGTLIIAEHTIDDSNKEIYFKKNIASINNSLLLYNQGTIQNVVIQDGTGKIVGATERIYALLNGMIALIAKEELGYTVYILDEKGRLLQKLVFDKNKFPSYTDVIYNDDESDVYQNSDNVIGMLKTIVPSYDGKHLFVQFDYYRYDTTNKNDLLTIDLFDSKIYRVNIAEHNYDKKIDIPSIYIEKNITLVRATSKGELMLVGYFNDIDKETKEALYMSPVIVYLSKQGIMKKEKILQMPDVEYDDIVFNYDEYGNIASYFLLKDRIEVYFWKH